MNTFILVLMAGAIIASWWFTSEEWPDWWFLPLGVILLSLLLAICISVFEAAAG